MKKITLLLITLLCASALNSMQEPSYATLPSELKQEIVHTALATSNNDLDKTIQMIEKLSALHNVRYDNLEDFTKLVHLLAKKFDTTPDDIAQKFKQTSIAKKYHDLCKQLYRSILYDSIENNITQVIAQGADIDGFPTLFIAVRYRKDPDIIQLLLNHGANPHRQSNDTRFKGQTALEILNDIRRFDYPRDDYEQIKSLLENAMTKK